MFLTPDIILRHLPLTAGMSVGEFGVSGAGTFAQALSERVGTDGRVFLFDVQKSVLTAAVGQTKQRGRINVQAIWTDLEVPNGTQGLKPHSLDGSIAVQLFSHCKHPREALQEIRRLLKPGAHLAVVDWEKGSHHPLAPQPAFRLTADYLAQQASTVGFAVDHHFSPDEDHWGVLLTAR